MKVKNSLDITAKCLFLIFISMWLLPVALVLVCETYIARFDKNIRTEVSQIHTSLKKEVDKEKEKLYNLINSFDDVEDKTIVIERSKGKYYLRFIEEVHEDTK